jgi:serine/threonine protein kinase
VFYVAFDGEDFNNCALLDEYEMGQVLGEGGFGKVVLAKHVLTRKKVAIKFMDIQDQRKGALL